MCVLFLQDEKFDVMLFVILLVIGTANGAMLPYQSLNIQENHLVRCLTYISQRYFPPGRSLVISSPSTYRHVQQELIAEIHRTAIWPIVVTVDGKINKQNKTGFIDKDGSYIILTSDGNLKSLRAEVIGLALEGEGSKFSRLWNSEARFVVAGAVELSISQQIEIFNYLSKWRIYNCIIVSQEHYVVDEEYSRTININNVDTVMKLVVYTWFPYQSSGSCTEVNNMTLLDSWVISAQGHFARNTDLFPQEIGNTFNGCPMKAVVRDAHWEVTTKYVNVSIYNGTLQSGFIEGLEYDLLKVVMQQKNMTFFISL